VTVPRAIVLGGLVVGVLDIADAFIFFGLRGASPVRILQGIAGGLLGRDSFAGGWQTAALGLAIHFFIATVVVAVYVLASRHMRWLVKAPFITGPLYGIGVWLVMNFVVLPLSASGPSAFRTVVVINGLLIHMLGVGLPSALFARAAGRSAASPTDHETRNPR
jgi:hypothetical protein